MRSGSRKVLLVIGGLVVPAEVRREGTGRHYYGGRRNTEGTNGFIREIIRLSEGQAGKDSCTSIGEKRAVE